jgi:hypothetical protein
MVFWDRIPASSLVDRQQVSGKPADSTFMVDKNLGTCVSIIYHYMPEDHTLNIQYCENLKHHGICSFFSSAVKSNYMASNNWMKIIFPLTEKGSAIIKL